MPMAGLSRNSNGVRTAALIVGTVAVMAVQAQAQAQVLINEVLPNPDNAHTEEWVELYNVGDTDVDLGGWSLSDSNGYGSSGSLTIDAGTTIAPGEYLVFVVRGSDGLLNNGGDDLELSDANSALVDELTWTSSAPGDLSMARQVRTMLITCSVVLACACGGCTLY